MKSKREDKAFVKKERNLRSKPFYVSKVDKMSVEQSLTEIAKRLKFKLLDHFTSHFHPSPTKQTHTGKFSLARHLHTVVTLGDEKIKGPNFLTAP